MEVEQRDRRIQTICLLVLTSIAVGVALYFLRGVLVPFVLAFFIAFVLTPIVDLQVGRLRVPSAVAVAATLLFALFLLALAGGIVSASVSEMSENQEVYAERIDQLMQWVTERLPVDSWEERARPYLARWREGLNAGIGRLIEEVMALLGDAVLVLIFLIFLLAGRRPRENPPTGVRGEVETSIKRYLANKLLISILTGAFVGSALALFGVPMALVFGLLSFMLNFIPQIGSAIATLLPLPVVLMSPDLTPLVRVLAAVSPVVINFILGNLVEPKIMGTSVGLHPVTILLALVFWGMLWGIVGMLLAVPMTASLKILFEKLDYTRPVADLLAGRPFQRSAG